MKGRDRKGSWKKTVVNFKIKEEMKVKLEFKILILKIWF